MPTFPLRMVAEVSKGAVTPLLALNLAQAAMQRNENPIPRPPRLQGGSLAKNIQEWRGQADHNVLIIKQLQELDHADFPSPHCGEGRKGGVKRLASG